jgi:cholesterol transport system auxiliary component
MATGTTGARRSNARALSFAALAFFVASCAQPARETFDLASLPSARGGAAGGPALSVREPTAVAPTSTDRVVVRDQYGSVSVLPGVQWSERLPGLLQDRMVGALQRAGLSAARISVGATRALTTEVRRFEIDVARNVAVVEIAARIVDESSGSARAAQTFIAEVPAPEHTGSPAVHALAEAAAQALSRLAGWARGRV